VIVEKCRLYSVLGTAVGGRVTGNQRDQPPWLLWERTLRRPMALMCGSWSVIVLTSAANERGN